MIKLQKLPDRTPIKISISVNAALHQALLNYADVYAMTYGEIVTIQDIIPFMLEGFLGGDRAFTKTMKTKTVRSSQQKPRGRKKHLNNHSVPTSPILNA